MPHLVVDNRNASGGIWLSDNPFVLDRPTPCLWLIYQEGFQWIMGECFPCANAATAMAAEALRRVEAAPWTRVETSGNTLGKYNNMERLCNILREIAMGECW